MSSRTRSNRSDARISPAAPSRSVTISWPSVWSAVSNSSTFMGSSSTRRMRKLPPSVGACTVDPSLPEPAQPALQTDTVDRFREVVGGAEGEGGRRIRFDGHDDHWLVSERGIGPKPSQELLAAPVRQPQVEDDSERTSSGERVFGAGEAAHDLGSQVHRGRDRDD